MPQRLKMAHSDGVTLIKPCHSPEAVFQSWASNTIFYQLSLASRQFQLFLKILPKGLNYKFISTIFVNIMWLLFLIFCFHAWNFDNYYSFMAQIIIINMENLLFNCITLAIFTLIFRLCWCLLFSLPMVPASIMLLDRCPDQTIMCQLSFVTGIRECCGRYWRQLFWLRWGLLLALLLRRNCFPILSRSIWLCSVLGSRLIRFFVYKLVLFQNGHFQFIYEFIHFRRESIFLVYLLYDHQYPMLR